MAKKPPIPCTKEEIENIINAASDDEFFYMLFKVAAKTGRRLGEYYDVQVKHFNPENQTLLTKVLKRRMRVLKEAILDDELTYLIKGYIARHRLKLEDYLFRKVSYRQIQNRTKSYANKAGVDHNVTFHNFRHFLVTHLVKKGWTYERIAKLTGHSSPGTLVAYDHTVASDVAVQAREDIRDL